jgi:hypothetical protein
MEGVTLALSVDALDCGDVPQTPYLRTMTAAERRAGPELAVELAEVRLGRNEPRVSWLAIGEGASSGHASVFIERITESEIHALVEFHEEDPGSAGTRAFVHGHVVFKRCL